jgi:hypothetical protein
MNHNKYSSPCKKHKLKIVMKLKIKILLKHWGGVKCTQEYASKIFFGIGSQFVPYPWLKSLLVYYIDLIKTKHYSHIGEKCFNLGSIKNIMIFCEGPIKVASGCTCN